MLPWKRVLCPLDFSACSYQALEIAQELAATIAAELVITHVITPVPPLPYAPTLPAFNVPLYLHELEVEAQRILEEIAEPRAARAMRPRVIVRHGDPAREILELARELRSDLIVVGTRGAGALRRLIYGSVAHTIMHHASCAVLAVPPPPEE